jgi:hypothetical protein
MLELLVHHRRFPDSSVQDRLIYYGQNPLYFAEDWDRFDKTMAQIIEEEWPQAPSMGARHDLIHRLLTGMIIPLDPMGSYAYVQDEIWYRAQPEQELVDYVRQEQAQSEFIAV